jgi:hypothetical protein
MYLPQPGGRCPGLRTAGSAVNSDGAGPHRQLELSDIDAKPRRLE